MLLKHSLLYIVSSSLLLCGESLRLLNVDILRRTELANALCAKKIVHKNGPTSVHSKSQLFPRLRKSVLYSSVDAAGNTMSESERKDLWKSISSLERQAVEILLEIDSDDSKAAKEEEVFKLLAESTILKSKDPFLALASRYEQAKANNNSDELQQIISNMKAAKLPPHLSSMVENLSGRSKPSTSTEGAAPTSLASPAEIEDVDPGSTFSDTVTEKIRVKVNSFYDRDKSDPANGKYMFWYKVAIYNEGPEPVQIVARMWEIEKCRGEKEVVRGAGIMSTQPIIPPGDVFTYQSVCPLKVHRRASKFG